jgi:YVTN family beta-propeller protein
MHFFNTARTHAVIAYVTSGHVLFMDAATRTPIRMIDVGVQAHAAFPAPDDSYVIVANQNGKMLHRIWTDYKTNTFTLDPVALNLAVGTTPSGAPRQDPVLRPDTAPICGIIEPTSRLAFVTLRGGGLFVVDASGPELRIVNEYDKDTIHRDGCGGVIAGDKLYINSGGPGESDLYAFRLSQFDTTPDAPNTPARALVYSQDGPPATTHVDSHGGTLVGNGRYLWVADRWANKIVVVDTKTDRVVNEIAVAGELSADPAPDLLAASPDGNRVYATFRGPVPLTANNPAFNNAVGATPGVGVLRVTKGGRDGRLIAVAPITHVVSGVERADPHSLAVREVPRRHHGGRSAKSLVGIAPLQSAQEVVTAPLLTAPTVREARDRPAVEPLLGAYVDTTEQEGEFLPAERGTEYGVDLVPNGGWSGPDILLPD